MWPNLSYVFICNRHIKMVVVSYHQQVLRFERWSLTSSPLYKIMTDRLTHWPTNRIRNWRFIVHREPSLPIAGIFVKSTGPQKKNVYQFLAFYFCIKKASVWCLSFDLFIIPTPLKQNASKTIIYVHWKESNFIVCVYNLFAKVIAEELN